MFSPFSMIGVGDGTLHAFSDLMRQLDFLGGSKYELESLDIIGAAVTSARFPGVVPAWPLEHAGRKNSYAARVANRLNFVDGGYADNSGATTAVDIIERLKKHVDDKELSDYVRFRLVLLTDSETNVDIPRIRGTSLPDVIAPANALLNARQLLARTAVTRARNELLALFGGPDPESADSPLVEIVLDHRMFQLPLGWLLSSQTERLISLMLGDPSKCSGRTLDDEIDPELRRFAKSSVSINSLVDRNSCAMKRIRNLL